MHYILILFFDFIKIAAQYLERPFGIIDNVVDFRLHRCGFFCHFRNVIEHAVGFFYFTETLLQRLMGNVNACIQFFGSLLYIVDTGIYFCNQLFDFIRQ